MHNVILAHSADPVQASNPLPRFGGDWISAWLHFDLSTGLLHVGAGPHDWILEPVDPEKLRVALDSNRPVIGQFNPDLKIALVPGAHQITGTSFFRLRS